MTEKIGPLTHLVRYFKKLSKGYESSIMTSWWEMLKSDSCGVKFLLMSEGLACKDYDMRGTIGMSGNFLSLIFHLYKLKLACIVKYC